MHIIKNSSRLSTFSNIFNAFVSFSTLPSSRAELAVYPPELLSGLPPE